MIKIADFLNYLREHECYDNTRIIITSDHGSSAPGAMYTKHFEYTDNLPIVKELVQAVLLYKDFNQNENVKTDMTFMPNADTPSLALKDIADNPKNPFTENDIFVINKDDYVKIAFAPMQSLRTRDDKKYTVKDNEWFTVKDNIFESKNWTYSFIKNEGE